MSRQLTVAKSGGKALTTLKKELATMAAEEHAAEPVVLGNFLSVKGKRFAFQDAVLGDRLNVVILDHCFENQFYKNAYDPESPSAPVCCAIGKSEKDLAPDPEVPGIQVQHETCHGCPQNEFGSAATGRGKACRNGRKLALISIPEDGLTAERVMGATVAFLRLSPTALRSFSGYLKRITATLQAPLFAVVTTLSFDESMDFPSVVATYNSPIEDKEILTAIIAKRKEIQDELLAGPQDLTPREQAPAPRSRKPVPRQKGGPLSKGKPAKSKF